MTDKIGATTSERILTDTLEYAEACYWAMLSSPTKGKNAIDELIAKTASLVARQERERVRACVEDAKRVHPDWTIDDVIYLLKFRDEVWQAFKQGREVK